MGVKTKTLGEALEKYIDAGGKPYAFICNKKTRRKIVSEMEGSSTLVEIHLKDQHAKYMPPKQLFFKNIPISIEETVPKDKVLIIDKETYLKIKEANAAFWDKNRKIMIDAAGKHESN